MANTLSVVAILIVCHNQAVLKPLCLPFASVIPCHHDCRRLGPGSVSLDARAAPAAHTQSQCGAENKTKQTHNLALGDTQHKGCQLQPTCPDLSWVRHSCALSCITLEDVGLLSQPQDLARLHKQALYTVYGTTYQHAETKWSVQSAGRCVT